MRSRFSITVVSSVVVFALSVTLALLAAQQPLRSAPKNVALHPVSANSPVLQKASIASSGSLKPSNIGVVVHPKSAPVTAKLTQQFIATVRNTTNTAVSWYVDGVLGGNSTVGLIDVNGIYTPPTNFSVGTHTIMAVSTADPTKSATASAYLVGYAGLFTNKNDNFRSGLNSQ